MTEIKYLTRGIFYAGLLLIVSCSSQQYDPNFWRHRFIDALNEKVGLHFSNIRNISGLASDRILIGESRLDNGHIDYNYGHGQCGYKLEVNPDTDVIVGVMIDAEKPDCFYVP